VSAKAKNGYREILDLQNPKTFELFKKAARRPKTKEEARKMLVEMGIHTKSGKLTKHFR
jgi:hypothetical protein